jgi:hypothetical protein
MYGNRLGPHLEGRMLNIFDYRRGFKQLVKWPCVASPDSVLMKQFPQKFIYLVRRVITGVSMKSNRSCENLPAGRHESYPGFPVQQCCPLTRTMSEEHQERPMRLSAMT